MQWESRNNGPANAQIYEVMLPPKCISWVYHLIKINACCISNHRKLMDDLGIQHARITQTLSCSATWKRSLHTTEQCRTPRRSRQLYCNAKNSYHYADITNIKNANNNINTIVSSPLQGGNNFFKNPVGAGNPGECPKSGGGGQPISLIFCHFQKNSAFGKPFWQFQPILCKLFDCGGLLCLILPKFNRHCQLYWYQ